MTIIRHNELKNYLTTAAKEQFPSAFLLYGDEFLYKTSLDDILDALIPVSKRSTSCESIEGTIENINESIEKLNTFSLIPGKKAVILSDAKFFYSKMDIDRIIEKAKNAYDEDNIKAASKYLVSILGLLQLSFDDITSNDKWSDLNLGQDNEWVSIIIRYCLENNISIPAESGNTASLEKAIEKGFPKDNHLIIISDIINKKHRLFKVISDKGLMVDCSVPKSDRAADKKVQQSVTKENASVILKQHKKTMGNNAYNALYEMTGFDLQTFTGNLEKLISYVGNREEITENDVTAVLKRTKKDPIYEFTNAIMERNTQDALFFLTSLLSSGEVEHPLQILSAMVNQIKRLLIIKDFTQSQYGKSWYKECSYDQFRSEVMPTIIEYDKLFLSQIQDNQMMLSQPSSQDNKRPSKSKKQQKASKKNKTDEDLMIAKNPNNPYPIYKILKNSENFSINHLIRTYERLNDVDVRLKSSPPSNHKLILEEAVLSICQKNEHLKKH